MADLSENMGKEDLRSLIFLLSETLPKGRQETATVRPNNRLYHFSEGCFMPDLIS